MLYVHKTENERLREATFSETGIWVHLCNPSPEEIAQVSEALQLEPEMLHAPLDDEERARIEIEDGITFIIVDIPYVKPEGGSHVYNTLPLGIILTENAIVTICLQETSVITDFITQHTRHFYTAKKTRFILQILYKISTKYLQYLRLIDKTSIRVEEELHRSMKNRELIQMLRLEKSLVFFSTSLKANEVVLERMLRIEDVKKYPDDTDLLEDVIIENKQAIEMCNIYRDILSGTMDAFASVISNNLNIVMKFLAAITIIIAIPSFVAALWGMNVPVPFEQNAAGFWIVSGISALAALITALIMWRKKMF